MQLTIQYTPFAQTQSTFDMERRVHDALVLIRQLSEELEGTIVLGTAIFCFHLQYTPSPHVMMPWKNIKPIEKKQKSKCTTVTNLNDPNLSESTNSVIDQFVRSGLKP